MLQSPTSLPHLLSLSASLPSPLPLPPLPLAPLLLLSSPLASLLLGPTWVPLCLACLSGDSSVANAVPVCPIKALKHCFVYGDSHLVWEQTSIILPCCQALEWDGGSGPRWERERERRMMDWTRSLIPVFHFHTDLCLISALTHTHRHIEMDVDWMNCVCWNLCPCQYDMNEANNVASILGWYYCRQYDFWFWRSRQSKKPSC